MNEDAIIHYVAETFAGLYVLQPKAREAPDIAIGDTFFLYDPQRNLEGKQQQPFATIVTKDYGDFDCASNLNRPGVFRLNIGVSKETFRSLFADGASHDYAALDTLIPHPTYASQSWLCVLNPSEATFAKVQPLLAEAYESAVRKYAKLRPANEP